MFKKNDSSFINKRSGGEKVLFTIVWFIFLLYALSFILPTFYIIATSLKDSYDYSSDIMNGSLFKLPNINRLDFANYIETLNKMYIFNTYGREIFLYEMFFNSLWYTLGSSIGGALISSFTAYALAKYKFVGRNAIYAVIIFTMTIPIMGSTGSTLKLLSAIGIYNSPLMLLTALGGFGFNFLILYGFFKSLPWSYAEAVFIDGGSHFTAFFRIMLPQARPAMITLIIMAWISAWNDYSSPLLYMPDFPTIASGLYKVQEKAVDIGDLPLYYAGLTLSVIPVIVLFSCCSDTIMKNFTMGGLKG